MFYTFLSTIAFSWLCLTSVSFALCSANCSAREVGLEEAYGCEEGFKDGFESGGLLKVGPNGGG